MKNIYIIPTNKPNELVLSLIKSKVSKDVLASNNLDSRWYLLKYQNIYITSDEEIKEGDYVQHTQIFNHIGFTGIAKVGKQQVNQDFEMKSLDGHYTYYSSKEPKVVLTIDEDLIKDGVQAINDEFLEWFVKNPSCEEIEVFHQDVYSMSKWDRRYMIIIPKEEPKQTSLVEKMKPLQEQWQKDMDKALQEPKQETLEEATEKLLDNYSEKFDITKSKDLPFHFNNRNELEELICEVVKLQQRRSYSDEEVIELLNKHHNAVLNEEYDDGVLNDKEWFEQFKKK